MGSATFDVFAGTTSDVMKMITPEGEHDYITFPLGTKLMMSHIDFLTGGGGTNTAVSFSRLGLQTAFLGKLGRDEHGSHVRNVLKAEGVEFIGVQDGQTGYSIILDAVDKDRTILTFKGANDTLGYTDIPHKIVENTPWLYSSSLVSYSYETLERVIHDAADAGVKVAFNPSSYQAKQGYGKLSAVLKRCTAIILNLEEARLLTGDEHADAKELSRRIAHKGQYTVITDGANGVTCHYNGHTYTLQPSKQAVAVETTGAGDAFASGFVAGLSKGKDLETSLKIGMLQAEHVIKYKGAKKGLLVWNDLEKKLADSTLTVETQQHEYEAPEGSAFVFEDGVKVRTLSELREYINIHERAFEHHVGEGYNHFADWVRDVFGDKRIEQQLRESTTLTEMLRVL